MWRGRLGAVVSLAQNIERLDRLGKWTNDNGKSKVRACISVLCVRFVEKIRSSGFSGGEADAWTGWADGWTVMIPAFQCFGDCVLLFGLVMFLTDEIKTVTVKERGCQVMPYCSQKLHKRLKYSCGARSSAL